MKKTKYSMTAKQRKEKRALEQIQKSRANATAGKPIADDTIVVDEPKAKASRKKMWILITAIVLGALLIFTAIILPITLLRNNGENPVATIYLSDKRKIEFVIWEKECPIAATNFIFLARAGFFNGNLIYDVQEERNFARFGAQVEYDKFKTQDKAFVDSVKNFDTKLVKYDVGSSNSNVFKNKFGYKLNVNTDTYKDRFNEKGILSYNYKKTADFAINITDKNTTFYSSNEKNPTSRDPLNLSAFGEVLNDKSMKVVEDIIKETKKNYNPGVDYYVGTEPQLRIKKIKFTNLNNKKWNNFEFASFMNTAGKDGSAVWNGWSSSGNY